MAFTIRWLGTACFEILLENGKTIIIDPYLDDSVSAPIGSKQVDGCDFIFLTHGHFDHVLDVGKLVDRFNARIYCSREVSQILMDVQHICPEAFRPITAGDNLKEEGFGVEVVRGVHVDFAAQYHRLTGGDIMADFQGDFKAALQKALEASLGPVVLPEHFETWMAQYPGGEQLNFVFDLEDKNRIYMAGSCPDPGVIAVAEKTRATLMLLQVLPGKTLEGLETQTAQFALASGADTIVPQHHDPLFKGAAPTDLRPLKQILSLHDVHFVELVPGQWRRFDHGFIL